MAATLNFLSLPIKPLQTKSKLSNLNQLTKPQLIKASTDNNINIKKKKKKNTTELFQNLIHQTTHHLKSSPLPLTVFTLPFLLDPQDALAAGGEFGIFEGRTLALIHPIAMGGLFLYTLWAGYLGWQWRRVRTTQNEINELKKQVKPVAVSPEGKEIPSPPSPIEVKIQELTEERKLLLKGSFKDRHFNAGSILLGFGVLESVGGGLNTWLRTGKLFPGPHLFAGAGITVLWAAAAALVPAMQKGNETARSLHIALNTINVLLFIWQIPTGIDIVFKVFEFTKWP
ncbi:hypothetical protein MKW98_014787 [Papaver atlanticum]|uniref:Uncharacterized protein n=1 Tax=Papaver atlanticum TaxID=357466 RepID=A0AAD4XCX8_9MAGN|nr:hypothetical protein MKW98_014787 [Papaver atlanticum]